MWNTLSLVHYRHVSTAVADIIRVTDVHRTVHPNIIVIVKPTRCSNVSNLFYFGMTVYMFRTVSPSIFRSSRLYIQQQAFVKQMPVAVCTVLNCWWWTTMLYTTSCKHSPALLRMDEIIIRNMLSWLKLLIKLLLLHLVGCLYYWIFVKFDFWAFFEICQEN